MASTTSAPGADKAGATAAFSGQARAEPYALERPSANQTGQPITQRDGTWGETQRGESVNVEQAMKDFALARQQSRHSSIEASRRRRASGVGSNPPNRDPSALRQVEEGAVVDEHDEEEHFDLGNWMSNRRNQAAREGLRFEKPLGVSWQDLNVYAPGAAVGAGVLNKNLLIAIVNTVTRDPIAVMTTLFPPLKALMMRGQPESKLVSGQYGVLKAGEMLLVLGRPGSGCSTTLRALTSSSHDNLRQDGTLIYGGFSPDEVNRKYRGEAVFIDEDDIHFPTLTVEQTLRFALRMKVPRKRLSTESRTQFIDQSVEVLLKMFGMSHVRDTVVGDAAVRGISGGERKRVTIQEALITRASVMAWDNSTRGLDASTALDYARSLRILTDVGEKTTIATLYQVSESIYDLFDRVSVIDDGRCIYYGPRDQAREYFHALGYHSPARQTTADFVTAVTDPNQVQYREGFESGKAPRSAEERERAWKSSTLYKDLLQEIDGYNKSVTEDLKAEHAEALKLHVRSEKNFGVHKGSSFTVNFFDQVTACIWRALLIKWGARQDVYIKLFTIISVSLMVGSVFYGEDQTSKGAFTRGGVILFAALFNGWLQLSEAFEAVAGRPMLNRHRQFAFYHPSAVAIARAVVDVPFLLIQCFLTCIIIYFITNLRSNGGAFWIFFVYTFLSAYNLTALYRLFAAFSPGFIEAVRFGVLGLNFIVIWVGYVIRKPQMNWTIFVNYINGISYAFEGMLTNEFRYDIQCAAQQIIPFGEVRDVAYQTCGLTGSKPGSLVVTSQDYLATTFEYSQSHTGPWIGVLIAFSVLYLIPTVWAAEIMKFGGGGGGVTIFARTNNAKKRLAEQVAKNDVEDAPAASNTNGVDEKPRKASGAASDCGAATRVATPASEENKKKLGEATSQEAADGGKATGKAGSKTLEERAVFTWRDINLELESGRKLLQHVDGWVKPGEMTALMGASGAGKTTLMTALSQRGAPGTVYGDMLIDGKALGAGFQKGTGLVLQADVHLASQTVREAIEFSALLRQPAEVSREDKLAEAQRCIDLLELNDLADALIGVPGAGLGVERRKRVTIAVELAAKPDLLLFLDEPTSGLDSAGAASICRLLRRLTEQGQAILCTIHQPSALLFEAFDNVLLLAPGGRTTYMGQIGEKKGHGSDRVRRYFENNGAPACPPDANVAEYMLEVVSGGKSNGIDWPAKWRESPEAQRVREYVDQLNEERRLRPLPEDPRANSTYSANVMTQLVEVTKRQFVDLWRDPSFAYGVFFSAFVCGLVAGGAFAHLGYSPTDYQNRVFIVFLIILNFPAVVNSVISKFFEIRMLFEIRESASRVYAWWALMTSFLVTTVPIFVISSVLFFLPTFYIPFYSRPSWVAGYFYLMMLLVNFFMTTFALILAASCQTPVIASNLLPFLLPVVALINGVLVPHSQMPNPWRDFVYWVNPLTHYLRGQIATTMHGLPVKCIEEDLYRFNPPPNETCMSYAGQWVSSMGGYLDNPLATSNCGYCQYSVGDQFATTLNSPFDFRWQSFGIFLGFCIFNVGLSYFLYWYFSVAHYGIGINFTKNLVMAPFRRLGRSRRS